MTFAARGRHSGWRSSWAGQNTSRIRLMRHQELPMQDAGDQIAGDFKLDSRRAVEI